MARKLRGIEQIKFSPDELTRIVAWMTRLTAAEDGWINLVPRLSDDDDDDDERPTSLGFFALLGGGAIGITMGTWIPPSHHPRRGLVWPSLGISQVTGRRAVAELNSLALPVPETWRIEQDHPRRGLILRLPPGEAPEKVLAWALRAVALCTYRPIATWRADVHLPAKP